jgi:hypothetical protein
LVKGRVNGVFVGCSRAAAFFAASSAFVSDSFNLSFFFSILFYTIPGNNQLYYAIKNQ